MLVNDLESLFTFFHDRKFEDLLAYYSPLCSCQPNCRPSVFGRTFIYTPQPEDFIKELIDQYKLKMKCPGKDCDDSVPLCLAKDDCCDYYLQGHCIASGANAVINLYRRDGAKDLQIRWYNDHAQLFDYPDLLYFEKMISVDPAFANASKYLFGKIEHDKKSKKGVDTLDHVIAGWDSSATLAYYKKDPHILSNSFDYMLHLSWMVKRGELSINPFGFTDPSLLRTLTAANQQPKDTIDKHVINMASQLIRDSALGYAHFRDMFAILKERDSLLHIDDSASKASQASDAGDKKKMDSLNTTAMKAFQNYAYFRNKVISPLSQNSDSALHVRNYYFNRDVDRRDFGYLYPDNERLVSAIHNVPLAFKVGGQGSLLTYNDQPELTQNVNSSTALSLPSLNNAATFIGTSGGKTSLAEIADSLPEISPFDKIYSADYFDMLWDRGGIASLLAPPPDYAASYATLYEGFLKDFRRFHFFDSLYNASQLPPLYVQETLPDSPALITRLTFFEGNDKSPTEVDYKLPLKNPSDTSKNPLTVMVDSSYFKFGKSRLVELTLGVTYTLTHNRVTNIARDPVTGNLDIGSVEQKSDFMVALKFHFLKKVFLGNSDLIGFKKAKGWDVIKSRISFIAGTSISDPLKNIYTGFGADLIPGLTLSSGVQWFSNTSYSILNNQILRQTTGYRPALFLGISADPLAVVSILTAFFK
jgi:hypothetical protein